MSELASQPHISVLYTEALEGLALQRGGRYIDGTLGWGGHSLGLLQRTEPDGEVLAIDQDQTALAAAQQRLHEYSDRITLVQGNYRDLDSLAQAHGWQHVDGILLDIGVSSPQLDTPERGFSFQHDAELDMRMDQRGPQTAADLINSLPEQDLADLIFQYGEERQSRRIARRIVDQRKRAPIMRTSELAKLIATVIPAKRHQNHPATRTFQALRIAVNDELGALKQGLAAATNILRPGGRLAVISFHSLEDRIIKEWIRDEANDCRLPAKMEVPGCPHLLTAGVSGPRHCIFPDILSQGRHCDYAPRLRSITKKPITANEAELAHNNRARSAKLRIAEKT